MPAPLTFDGVLFFPVTPFGDGGDVDEGVLRDHVAARLDDGAGAVFAGCGTGEFHALSIAERAVVARVAAQAVAGRPADDRVPVVAGVGGALGDAIESARRMRDTGADALLLLPPYLVSGPQHGLARWVETIVEAADLPVVLYHRANALYRAATVERLVADPRVIGVKDGHGDIAMMQELVAAATAIRPDLLFFNGLLTAEVSQAAYRGIGVPLYSSAAFAMAPGIATAFYEAYRAGDEPTRLRILREFYLPLVRLRDETPGFAVSLVKAGLRLQGVPVGSVRPPLADPTDEQLARLGTILEAGERLAQELADTRSATAAAPRA
ncbi:5-dehydro-4-deoxyglucarate dehydratase [Frondihabitans australicus]|uniref:Probable 5-dehydro-4-deoxyglucarate dehydratase n=1 Tax=Frondihabitans australicus TaxID=386892 RepID=A0A495ID54_9MICO|nr:5-dehydro-4-deoxyglucarate dehydratase [Frondihabitans australicus]RKR73388.1 5-dehydro-4-deoxyglucarate dehydratase [Frondihabitans australicus]